MAREKKGNIQQADMQPQRKVLEFNTEEQQEEPKRRRSHGWIIIVILLLLAGAVVYLYVNQTKSYNDFEVVSKTENSNATQMSYLAYNGSMLKYSREGISYLDKDGTAIWVESYNLKQPKAVVSGQYIAVADLNGSNVYIFNADGKVNSIETPYVICNVDVAAQGVFAVVLENETENYIELYDKNGTNLVEMKTTIADSGYPLDIALSNDGTKLITSYVTIDGITMQNSIAAYNFGDVGQNATDRLVGGFNNLGDTIVPKVEFLDNDTVCAFGDNQFIIYSMKEKPSEKSTIHDFHGEIQSIFYNSKYIGIVEKNSEAEEAGEARYQLRVFDTNGKEKFSRQLTSTYKNIYATEDEIIIVGTSESRIYDFFGNLKFSYSFPKEVDNIVPTGSPQKYIVVYDDSTEMIKLQYTKEENEKVQE